MSETIRFLLIYDHDLDELIERPRAFVGDAQMEDALDAYDEAEQRYASERDRYEVLLVGADSIESIQVTHGRFFRRSDQSFDGVIAATMA